jgi:hypothetical protein
MKAQGYRVKDNVFFPRQQELNYFGEEWESFKQQAHKAH